MIQRTSIVVFLSFALVLGAPSISSAEASPPPAVERVSAREFIVHREVLGPVVQRERATPRFVEDRVNGQAVGVRVFGIKPGSSLDTLGIENGDRLESVNGLALTSPGKVLEAYGKVKDQPRVTLMLERRGTDLTFEYRIE